MNKAIELANHPVLDKDTILLKNLNETPRNYQKLLTIFEKYRKPIKNEILLKDLDKTNEMDIYANTDILRIYNYPIFIIDDITAYCAIFKFYMKDYKNCINSLLSLEKMLLTHKSQYLGASEDEIFNKDIFGFKFSVMSLNECYYSLLLANMLLGNYLDALRVANQLLITIKPQVSYWVILIRYAIQQTLGNLDKGNNCLIS